MERSQLNLRISDELGKAIDAKRIELSAKLGHIPSRSDVLRLALERYLQLDLSATDADRRRTDTKSPKAKRKPSAAD
jgi:hypothetical protein